MNFLQSVLVGTAHAQTNGQFNVGTFSQLFSISTSGSLSSIIQFAISVIVFVAAFLAFIYLVISGFQYITAGGDAEKATKARAGILNAIIGLIIIALAYIIIKFVGNLFNTGSVPTSINQ
jgi:hypothetical protein